MAVVIMTILLELHNIFVISFVMITLASHYKTMACNVSDSTLTRVRYVDLATKPISLFWILLASQLSRETYGEESQWKKVSLIHCESLNQMHHSQKYPPW